MGLRLLDKAFWLTGFLGQCLLLGILVSRKRTRRFPLFTSFIAFEIAQTALNFAVYRLGNQTEYFRTYWTLAVLDALLQLAVVFEMAREVFRPTGTWVSEARTLFLGIGLAGAAMAAGLSFAVDPKATKGLYAWFIRLDLFTSLLIAELVVAMFLAASRVGLQWRNWVMGKMYAKIHLITSQNTAAFAAAWPTSLHSGRRGRSEDKGILQVSLANQATFPLPTPKVSRAYYDKAKASTPPYI